MSFSISGKLRCGLGLNFKPSHGRPIFTENLSIIAKPEKTHLNVCHTSGPIKHESCWLFLLQRQRFQNKIMKEITIAKNIAFKMCNNNFTLCTRRTTEWIIAIWQFFPFSHSVQRDNGPQSDTRQFNYYALLSNVELSFSDLSDEFKHQILKTQTSSKYS